MVLLNINIYQTGIMNRYIELLCCIALPVTLFTACSPADDDNAIVDDATSASAIAAGPQIVQVTARDYFFEAPAEIPAGWTTFEFVNVSPADHFALLTRVPEGIGVAEYREELTKVAQNFLDGINETAPSYPDAGFELPGWYENVQVMGGPGLTAPGRTSRVTTELSPGNYILECYMKTPDGTKFHATLGMVAELKVTERRSAAAAPTPTLNLTLRNDGMQAPADVPAGDHTIAVHFEEQQAYENLGQNDVHLVKLEDDTDLAAIGGWINALTPTGLTSPPAPAVFLGGIQEMPVSTTGYFSARLDPGRYAWISEVPDPAAKGMLKTFTVPPGR